MVYIDHRVFNISETFSLFTPITYKTFLNMLNVFYADTVENS